MNSTLLDLFNLEKFKYIYIIGGGGKTTLLFSMAEQLWKNRRTVVTSTSTKIICPGPDQAVRVLVTPQISLLPQRLAKLLPHPPHITVAARFGEQTNKLVGFTTTEFDRLWAAQVTDYLLIEGDGANGRSFKAHGKNEPVVSPNCDLVIAVIGVNIVGSVFSAKTVHRAEVFEKLMAVQEGAIITPSLAASAVFHPDNGYLRSLGQTKSFRIFISQVKNKDDWSTARELAEALRQQDQSGAIDMIAGGNINTSTSTLRQL